MAAAALAGGWAAVSLNERVTETLAASIGGGVELRSAPFRIRPGLDLEAAGVERRLARLGYRETPHAPSAPGQLRRDPKRLEIALRGFDDGEGSQRDEVVRLELEGPVVKRIVRLRDQRPIEAVWLEPEPLGVYGRATGAPPEVIRPVPLERLPPHVVQAVLAAEDVRFAIHPGVDPVGIVRAAWANLRAGDIEQGGSTITQQLVKNMMVGAERTWRRKVEEAALAVIIDYRVPKEQILQTYLDTVYMGRIGSVQVRGIAQAARGFFAKEPHELTIAEAATLAGLIRAPNTHSPIRHPERARSRRDQVLGLMAENGWIDAAELAAARAAPLATRPTDPREAPWFTEEVLREIQARRLSDGASGERTVVTTSLDLELQRAVERAVADELAALEKRFPGLRRKERPVEAGAVVLAAPTGRVLALAGGRDPSRNQFNHATRAHRQPGSSFKPFVYLAAADAPQAPLTPSTILLDAPLQVRRDGRTWRPNNHDKRFLGRITARHALEQSRNAPAYHVAERVGMDRVRALAAQAGLGEMPDVPSLALGTGEVTLLDLTAAYAVFPNLGRVRPASLIRTVRRGGGAAMPLDRGEAARVASAPASYVVSHLLEGVVDRGTAREVRRLGLDAPLAGKTGTTDRERDAWFVGYSKDFVVGVWVGFDDGRPIGLSAARAAIPVWVPIMRRVLASYGTRPFPVPEGVVFRDVERRSGLLATSACSDSIHEAFVAGTEPRQTCESAPRQARAVRGDSRPGSRDPSFWEEVGGFFKGLFGAD